MRSFTFTVLGLEVCAHQWSMRHWRRSRLDTNASRRITPTCFGLGHSSSSLRAVTFRRTRFVSSHFSDNPSRDGLVSPPIAYANPTTATKRLAAEKKNVIIRCIQINMIQWTVWNKVKFRNKHHKRKNSVLREMHQHGRGTRYSGPQALDLAGGRLLRNGSHLVKRYSLLELFSSCLTLC